MYLPSQASLIQVSKMTPLRPPSKISSWQHSWKQPCVKGKAYDYPIKVHSIVNNKNQISYWKIVLFSNGFLLGRVYEGNFPSYPSWHLCLMIGSAHFQLYLCRKKRGQPLLRDCWPLAPGIKSELVSLAFPGAPGAPAYILPWSLPSFPWDLSNHTTRGGVCMLSHLYTLAPPCPRLGASFPLLFSSLCPASTYGPDSNFVSFLKLWNSILPSRATIHLVFSTCCLLLFSSFHVFMSSLLSYKWTT